MKTSYGFTLVESLIAISIVTLSIVGPMATADRAIVAAETARDQLIASYLAQEGIEYVRGVRDDEFLKLYPGDTSAAWTNFQSTIAPCDATSNPAQACTFDPVPYTVTSCLIGSSCNNMPLYLTAATNGRYTQNGVGTVKTSFTRTIQVISYPADPNDERVISKVSWSFHGTAYAVTITDNLTPWQ